MPPHAPPLSAGLSTHHSARRTRRYSTATAEAPSSNPLLIQTGLPKFGAIEADNVEPAVKQLLESLQADFDKLEARAETASGQDAYKETVEGMEVHFSFLLTLRELFCLLLLLLCNARARD